MAIKTAYDSATATDEALVALAKSGRMDAFEVLAGRYEQPLFRFTRWMLGNPADAEDMVQETLIKTYNALGRFRDGAAVRPWIFRIAANSCRDLLRARRRHPSTSLEGQPFEDPHAGPCETAEANGQAQRLAAAVDALPEKHRAVFLLARYEDLPYDEIAAVLRIPLGTVKSRINRAVKLLLERIEAKAL